MGHLGRFQFNLKTLICLWEFTLAQRQSQTMNKLYAFMRKAGIWARGASAEEDVQLDGAAFWGGGRGVVKPPAHSQQETRPG